MMLRTVSWAQAGPIHLVDGQFCLLPISIGHLGSALRSTGVLPYAGQISRRATIASLSALESALHVRPLQDSFLSSLFPPSLFLDDGSLRRRVQGIAHDVSQHAAIPLLIEGVVYSRAFGVLGHGTLCKLFLQKQGCTRESETYQCILHSLQTHALGHDWPVNAKAH